VTTTLDTLELSVDALRARPGHKWHHYPPDVLPAWVAEMDFPVSDAVRAALARQVEIGMFGYEDPASFVALADAFAEYQQRRFGWALDSTQVLPLADLVQGLFLAVSAFSAPGDGVVLHTPIYPPFLHAVRETGRRVVENRLLDTDAGFRLDPDGLRRVIDPGTRLILLCHPHNPTGRVFTPDELRAVAEVALERDLVLVSDEVHADLVYPGAQHRPLAALGPEVAARTVTLSSATKAFNIPGLRTAVVHFGSAALREQALGRVPERLLGRANQMGVHATIAAWRDRGPWLDAVRQRLAENRARLTEVLASRLPGVRYHPPEATYLAWLDCRDLGLGGSPHQFFLERARVGLSDGAEFGPPGQGCVRLNFATSPRILDEILERMARAVEEHAARRGR
jgi:cysteine-S-conjugate beta-lyase